MTTEQHIPDYIEWLMDRIKRHTGGRDSDTEKQFRSEWLAESSHPDAVAWRAGAVEREARIAEMRAKNLAARRTPVQVIDHITCGRGGVGE